MAEQFINGPAGELEAVVSTPAHWQSGSPVAVCCHPHPLHGGTLQNKVVHILSKTFTELGAKTVRFNFRGVGKSAGQFDQGEGESEDLLAVTNATLAETDNSPLWLAGFSFGAFIALRTHQQLQPERLLLVAPPVGMYPQIKTLKVITKKWVLVQGGQDEIVDAGSVLQWANSQALAPIHIFDEQAGHFFHGRLTWLQQQILQHWA